MTGSVAYAGPRFSTCVERNTRRVGSEAHARPQAVTGSTQISTPRIVMRNYLSTQHLYAARYAAQDAVAVEAAWRGHAVFDLRHRGYVRTAVVESVAFLEAAINELYQDSAGGHASYIGTLSPECIRLMSKMWRSTDRGRLEMFEKFDLALVFAGQQRFNRGGAPHQDAALRRTRTRRCWFGFETTWCTSSPRAFRWTGRTSWARLSPGSSADPRSCRAPETRGSQIMHSARAAPRGRG